MIIRYKEVQYPFIVPTDTTDDKDSKNKPRRVINYHKSLENLSDEFWKSVERAASPLGRGRSKFRDLLMFCRGFGGLIDDCIDLLGLYHDAVET